MSSTTAPKFGVKFPTRQERTVKRVTKCETREIQKRLEPSPPPKPVRVRPPPKPKAPKKPPPPPATLVKPAKPPRAPAAERPPSIRPKADPAAPKPPKGQAVATPRTLQLTDLEKLARLNCSREFSLFHQFIKADLSRSYENQLAFLQTKLQHLKNEFINKQGEHLNFEQIRDYYKQAVQEHLQRQIQPDEYLTLADKFRQDIKQAIEKWLKKKELKPQKQVTINLQRRQERIRERIKETMVEQKKQQLEREATSSITSTPFTTTDLQNAKTTTAPDNDIMVID